MRQFLSSITDISIPKTLDEILSSITICSNYLIQLMANPENKQLWLAKITKSQKISSWIEKYLDAKTQKLQHEIIRKRWDGVALEKIVTSIRESN